MAGEATHADVHMVCLCASDSQTDEAEAAIAQLNSFNLGGSVLEVRFADKDAGASTSDRRPPPSDNIYCKAGVGHELEVSVAAADAEQLPR